MCPGNPQSEKWFLVYAVVSSAEVMEAKYSTILAPKYKVTSPFTVKKMITLHPIVFILSINDIVRFLQGGKGTIVSELNNLEVGSNEFW